MNTEAVHTVIEELDHAIGQLTCESSNEVALTRLLELRNNLLLKYKPDPNVDWSIKNKKAQYVLKHFQWTAVYK